MITPAWKSEPDAPGVWLSNEYAPWYFRKGKCVICGMVLVTLEMCWKCYKQSRNLTNWEGMRWYGPIPKDTPIENAEDEGEQ